MTKSVPYSRRADPGTVTAARLALAAQPAIAVAKNVKSNVNRVGGRSPENTGSFLSNSAGAYGATSPSNNRNSTRAVRARDTPVACARVQGRSIRIQQKLATMSSTPSDPR